MSFEALLTVSDERGTPYDRCWHVSDVRVTFDSKRLRYQCTAADCIACCWLGCPGSSSAQLLQLQRAACCVCRLILENSGVAEPHNIRDLFQDSAGLPIMQRVRILPLCCQLQKALLAGVLPCASGTQLVLDWLPAALLHQGRLARLCAAYPSAPASDMQIQLDTMVTVVDSATFLPAYSTVTPTAMRPDLGPSGSLRPVVDLLVEQLECDTAFSLLHLLPCQDWDNPNKQWLLAPATVYYIAHSISQRCSVHDR